MVYLLGLWVWLHEYSNKHVFRGQLYGVAFMNTFSGLVGVVLLFMWLYEYS